MLSVGNISPAGDPPRTLEIPRQQVEEHEQRFQDLPIPDFPECPTSLPQSTSPEQAIDHAEQMARCMEEWARVDFTGTLPAAVTEAVVGGTLFAEHHEIAWGMQVTGNWNETITGTGSLRVVDHSVLEIAPGRQLHAVLDTDARDWPFMLFTFVPDGAPAITRSTFSGAGDGGDGRATGFAALAEHFFRTERLDPRGEGPVETRVRSGSIRVDESGNARRIRFSASVGEYDTDNRQPTGRIGNIRGWICEARAYAEDPDQCLYETLQLVDHAPPHQRENVNYDNPGIRFSFSDPVDPASVFDNFSLTTRWATGGPREVSGEVIATGELAFAFRPDEPLLPGVIYEASVIGGPEGVLARDNDGYLEEGARWRFSTLVDHNRARRADRPPLEFHAYQTIRDADLVIGKPTLVRAYVDWILHETIHRNWQVTSYPAEIETDQLFQRIVAQFGREPDQGVIRVVHPERFSDEQRRQALHTINLFGWMPEWSGWENEVTVALTPHDPYPEAHPESGIEETRPFRNWSVVPENPMRFYYAFLTVGDWKDGVPGEVRALAFEMMLKAADFAEQVLPILSALPVSSPIEIDQASAEQFTESLARRITPEGWDREDWRNYRLAARAIRSLRTNMRFYGGPNNIYVVLYPAEFLDFGIGVREQFSNYPDRGAGMPITTQVPVSALAMGLVHEFGHIFGAQHRPPNAANLQASVFRDPSIEGFRIAPGGLHGWNKSASEGNAEHPSALVPLMWPAVRPIGQVFVSQEDYRGFMRAFESNPLRRNFGLLPSSPPVTSIPRQLASTADLDQAHAGQRNNPTEMLMVRGRVHPGGETATIDTLTRSEFDWPADIGPYRAELHDRDGRVLSTAYFNADPDPLMAGMSTADSTGLPAGLDADDPVFWNDFTAALVWHPDAVRLRIMHGERVLAERTAPNRPPRLTLDESEHSPGPDQRLRLAWRGESSMPLTYTLLYSRTGDAPWQVLRFQTTATAIDLESADLESGPNPTIRLIVHDGFYEKHLDVPVEM